LVRQGRGEIGLERKGGVDRGRGGGGEGWEGWAEKGYGDWGGGGTIANAIESENSRNGKDARDHLDTKEQLQEALGSCETRHMQETPSNKTRKHHLGFRGKTFLKLGRGGRLPKGYWGSGNV